MIVRGDEALLPRGSTRIEAADRLHVMVREEVAEEMDDLLERWRDRPGRAAAAPRAGAALGVRPCSAPRPWSEDDGDAGYPEDVDGVPVAEHLRTRRDTPRRAGGLADGRFACTGPQLALGGPLQLQRYARRRLAARGGRRRARLVAGGDRRAGALMAGNPAVG